MSESELLPSCPPWLLPYWRQLLTRHTEGKLPHALLFTGVDGIGKRQFVQFVAVSLLCHRPTVEAGACTECESCRQLLAQSHPDFRQLVPEGASMTIKIDMVRDLMQWLQLSAPPGRYRTAVVLDADSMNRHAANSLLKTLEEPSERAVLILSASRASALPSTIASRCQTTVLNLHDKAAAETWLLEKGVDNAQATLAAARVGPFALLAYSDKAWLAEQAKLQKAWLDLLLMRASIGRIVDSISEIACDRCLQQFAHWTFLAAKHAQQLPVGADPATIEMVSQVSVKLEKLQWFALYDRLVVLHRSDSASFKTQAVLEGLFADIRLMTQG